MLEETELPVLVLHYCRLPKLPYISMLPLHTSARVVARSCCLTGEKRSSCISEQQDWDLSQKL